MRRRLRAIALTAVMWSVPWGILGGVVFAVGLRLRGIDPSASVFGLPLSLGAFAVGLKVFGIFGAIAGAVFGTAMSIGERTRTLHTLSPRRFATWGALGGAALPITLTAAWVGNTGRWFNSYWVVIGAAAALGAASAWSMLRLARRARDLPPPEELTSGEVFPPARHDERESVYRSTP